jgi:hypothetical protein
MKESMPPPGRGTRRGDSLGSSFGSDGCGFGWAWRAPVPQVRSPKAARTGEKTAFQNLDKGVTSSKAFDP